jgi:hypothetical protein
MYEKCFISGENECQYECMENVLFLEKMSVSMNVWKMFYLSEITFAL